MADKMTWLFQVLRIPLHNLAKECMLLFTYYHLQS